MKAIYTRVNDSVLPPRPTNTSMVYASRNIGQQHMDSPNKFTQTWVITGLFPDHNKQTGKSLGKISAAYIDFDLVDTLVHQGKVEEIKALHTESGTTQLYKNGKLTDLAELDDQTIVKHFISELPVEQIQEMVETHFTPIMEQHVIPYIGKPQKITYTGHGCHAYFWLADNEGYTDLGAEHVEGEVKANYDAYKVYLSGLFKMVNTKMGYNAVDPAVKDLGTRCTRELGSVNIKNSQRPKTVVNILPNLVEADRRLTVEGFVTLPLDDSRSSVLDKLKGGGSSKKSKGANASSTGGRGRPPKFTPLALDYTDEVTVMIDGVEQKGSMQEFDETFDEIVALQGQVDKIRNCRVTSQLGEGSMNMYAVRPKDGKGVMFITTASKYMRQGDAHWKQDAAGNELGYYYYDGLAFELLRDGKGRIKKNVSNIQAILMHDKMTRNNLKYNSRLETVFIHRDLHLDVHGAVKREQRVAKSNEWFRFRDNHYITFEKILNRYGLDSVSDAQIQRCVKTAAMKLSYDPVTDWVESIEWDGVRRLDGDNAWICKMLHLPRDHGKWGLYSTYSRVVMHSILRNIYVGNSYPDVQTVLTLAGGQGVGKSLLSSVLGLTETIGMDYFHDSGIDMGSTAHRGDQIASMLGCFLVELPEAISLSSNATPETIKAFLTTKKDKGRLAYGREQEERIRSTYFMTNSNDNIFMSDYTGNRRYLVVDCFDDLFTEDMRLDVDHVRAILPQLFAESYRRCVQGLDIPEDRKNNLRTYEGTLGEEWNLNQQEREWQKLHNEKFTQPDYIVEMLSDLLNTELERGMTHVSYSEVKRKLSKQDPTARLSNQKFANAMSRCGWRKTSVKGNNRWLPSKTQNVKTRERVTPIVDPIVEAVVAAKQETVTTLAPVAEQLSEIYPVIESSHFKDVCSMSAYERILNMVTSIKATDADSVQPAQVTLLARHVNRVIEASI